MTEALLSLAAGILGAVAGAGLSVSVWWLVYDLPGCLEERRRRAIEAKAKDWWELDASSWAKEEEAGE